MNFDARDFRRALSKFATGVTVVTTRDAAGEHYGVTASSFNSVSVEPPLILWSIDKGAYSVEAYRGGEHFVVNVLGNDQVELSSRFARRGEDKFAGIAFDEGVAGIARMRGAAACFECRTWNVYEGGDHFIIVGEVLHYDYRDEGSALVFHNGRYAVPEPHPMALPVAEPPTVEGRLGSHFLYLLRQALSAYCSDFYPRLGSLGVNEKEWRILTLLADRGELAADTVARWVAQPLEDLEDTLSGLVERGLVERGLAERGLVGRETDLIGLTEQGRALSLRLLTMADEYESRVLKNLDESQVRAVKAGLGSVIERFGATA